MNMPIILAHGALGIWDEVVFILIGLIFLGMMLISWFRSRMSEPLLEEPPAEAVRPSPPAGSPAGHVPLE
jgi:uncharacterized protein YpmS